MNRILVIRGGAIGDFILTLPTLKALREAYPQAHLEILGYKHIAVLAENRFYAQAVRSIEYGPLSSFYDPDGIFENNLRRCGVENLIHGPAKVDDRDHAARQLARPLEELGLRASDFAPRIYPSTEDRKFAEDFLRGMPRPILAIHAGSGSEMKNWPIENWIEFGNVVLDSDKFRGSLIIVSGEADQGRSNELETIWRNDRVQFARNLPLPVLAALLGHAIFVGHDSGISHLAAAVGAKCILLFGPTNPEVWAPMNENVEVIRGLNGDMREIGCEDVIEAISLW